MTRHAPLIVVGGSGFVGRHLRASCAAAGEDVVLLSRRPLSTSPGERLVHGSLHDDLSQAGLPRDGVVVNLAYDGSAGFSANLALAEALVTLCKDAGARRLVHVSTAMVAGITTTRRITEDTECQPATEYQRIKLAVERHLRDHLPATCSLIVLRPTAVFGAGGLNLRKLVVDLKGRPWYENYARSCLFGARPLNLVPVETVVAAIHFAAALTPPPHDTYIVAADDAANVFSRVEGVLREALGLSAYPLPRVSLPSGLLDLVLRMAGRRSHNPNAYFASDRLIADGFVPPVTFTDALARYARVEAGGE